MIFYRAIGASAIAAVTLVIGVSTENFFVRLSARPHWEVTLRNTSVGATVEVFKSGDTQPTYEVLLAELRIAEEVHRIRRPELPRRVAETKFYDETFRPGRWTFLIEGREIDIMERALILDGGTEFAPAKAAN
jgi:hypothetical protein